MSDIKFKVVAEQFEFGVIDRVIEEVVAGKVAKAEDFYARLKAECEYDAKALKAANEVK